MRKYDPTIQFNGKKKIITIPYKVIDSYVEIKGAHIRMARVNAGIGDGGVYAELTDLWGRDKLYDMEKTKTIELPLKDVFKLINALHKPQDAAGSTKKEEGEESTPDSS